MQTWYIQVHTVMYHIYTIVYWYIPVHTGTYLYVPKTLISYHWSGFQMICRIWQKIWQKICKSHLVYAMFAYTKWLLYNFGQGRCSSWTFLFCILFLRHYPERLGHTGTRNGYNGNVLIVLLVFECSGRVRVTSRFKSYLNAWWILYLTASGKVFQPVHSYFLENAIGIPDSSCW